MTFRFINCVNELWNLELCLVNSLYPSPLLSGETSSNNQSPNKTFKWNRLCSSVLTDMPLS